MTVTSYNDKRITDILRNYWEKLRGDRPYPLESEIDPEALGEVWSHCFMVQLLDIKKKENYSFTYFGDSLQGAYAKDLTDTPVKYVVSPHAEHLAEQYDKVLKTGQPLIDEDSYTNRDHVTVLYRQCLLPLGCKSEDGIAFILGGMRYKLKP